MKNLPQSIARGAAAEPGETVNPRSGRARSVRRSSQQRVSRLVLYGALGVLGVWLMHDFLGMLGWAVILAIATWPLYERFLPQFEPSRQRLLAPALFTLLIALVFVAPLGLAAIGAGRDLNAMVARVAQAEHNGMSMPDWIGHLPFVGAQVGDWWQEHLAEPGAVTDLLGHADKGALARVTREIAILVASRLTFFLFTVLTLFFLFRDGDRLTQQFRTLNHRVFGKPGEHLAALVVNAIRSTADGLVLVGLGEGAFLTVGYVVLGVPHPALLGLLTGILAIIPFGAPVIFSAAALLLLAKVGVAPAVGLLAFGFLVVFVADHAIRPVLIGGGAKLPFLWVLLGIFGGLASFGVLGLFLGPAIMSALVSLWREWTDPASSDLPLD